MMARGHAQEAETCYTNVLESAQAHYPDDPPAVVAGDALLRDKQIAAELSISREGVRFHGSRIFTKLGVHNRSEAVSLARSIGLLRQSS